MEKEKSYLLDHIIFCSGCRQYLRPEVIAETITIEERIRDNPRTYTYAYKPPESTDSEEILITQESEEPDYNRYDQYNQILKCPILNCGKKYLRIYPNSEGKEEIIPFAEGWFHVPIPNPIENGIEVIPKLPYQIYHECVEAFNANMRISCALLLGVVLESICIESKIKDKLIEAEKEKRLKKGKYQPGDFILVNLKDMLPVLVSENNLEDDYSQLIETISKVRNDAAHEMIQLDLNELGAGIHSIETLFEELFLQHFSKRRRKETVKTNKQILETGLNNRRRIRHES